MHRCLYCHFKNYFISDIQKIEFSSWIEFYAGRKSRGKYECSFSPEHKDQECTNYD